VPLENNNETILDVVTNVTKDLRYNKEFVAMLKRLDDETVKRIASSYVEWLYQMLEIDREDNER
jgi:hypothetical protein